MALTCIKTGRVFLRICAAAACALVLGASAADADLLLLRDAAQKGNAKALADLRTRLAGHPLEAYPAYWLLMGQIARADPAEVRAFLKRYPDGPLAESLRREWLKSLAAAGSWEIFRAEHPSLVSD